MQSNLIEPNFQNNMDNRHPDDVIKDLADGHYSTYNNYSPSLTQKMSHKTELKPWIISVIF